MAKATYLTLNSRKFVDMDLNNETPRETLVALKEAVRADYLEAVFLPNDMVAWVDERGMFKEANFVHELGFLNEETGIPETIDVLGSVVITGRTDDGETIGLTEEQVIWLRENLVWKFSGYVKAQ